MSQKNFLTKGTAFYRETKCNCIENPMIPFVDICHTKGHLFLEKEEPPNPPTDFTKKCCVCDEQIIFKYYSKEALEKELSSLDILSN